MINNFIANRIRANFGFEPTPEQADVIGKLSDFLLDEGCRFHHEGDLGEVFLLHGFAGTGKTSLVSALVKALDQLRQRCVLMAPTGKAAKVFALYSSHPAFTIHRRIYRQRSLAGDASFALSDNLSKNTLFIVDEASMIGDDAYGSIFGSGHLLEDLLRFVYSGEGCRLLLLGDSAQLPPVGQEASPALSRTVLQEYGLRVREASLTTVMRQTEISGILHNATAIRERITALLSPEGGALLSAPLRLRCLPDVQAISGGELVEKLSDSYNQTGTDETIVVCRTNKNANIYNRGIRATILYREEELTSGDRVMIVKNNYFWLKENRPAAPTGTPEDGVSAQQSLPDFLANGDMAIVRRVRRVREMYGFRFADVTLELPDYDDFEFSATVLLDTLTSESPSLTKDEGERLFNSVMEDYQHISTKEERYKQLRENPYYNALQIKFAYAVTCHKAQGGQWDTVFLDQGWLPPETAGTVDYYRWLYTAITRATRRVFLVNWRKEELELPPETGSRR